MKGSGERYTFCVTKTSAAAPAGKTAETVILEGSFLIRGKLEHVYGQKSPSPESRFCVYKYYRTPINVLDTIVTFRKHRFTPRESPHRITADGGFVFGQCARQDSNL
jgi:hypothetical protein